MIVVFNSLQIYIVLWNQDLRVKILVSEKWSPIFFTQ